MNIYFMLLGCGFSWQVWGYEPYEDHRVIVDFRLYWRNMSKPKVRWALHTTKEWGISYTEDTRERQGTWVLRGPWMRIR